MNAQQRKSLRNLIALHLVPLTDAEKVKAEGIESLLAILDAAKDEVEAERDDEQEKFDNMPEGLQGSEKGEKAEQGISDLDDAISALEMAKDDADVETLQDTWAEDVANCVQEAIDAIESACDA